MCQHLRAFTWQVSETASYVFSAKHLEACAKGGRWPNGGVPNSSTSVGLCQTLSRAAGVDPPAPLRSAYLITRSFTGILTASLMPNTATIKRGSV